MTGPDLPRLAVLAGPEESLSPAEVARSADGLADYWFLLDGGDTSAGAEALRTVASALAPTAVVDFADTEACRQAIRRNGADAVTTFTDKFCPIAARLNADVQGTSMTLPPWGRKDLQRRMLLDAGLSRVQSVRVENEESVRTFVRSAGLPVVVKPTSGAASRDTWLLAAEPDIVDFVNSWGGGEPGRPMIAEQFIVGEPPVAPHLADYGSVEVFRSRCPARPGDTVPSQAFVTDRLVPAWPCRETGLVLPSAMPTERQRSVIAMAEKALDALHAANGTYHVEVKPAKPVPEVIEVNGRLGGFLARLVRYGTGGDLGRVALNCALGHDADLDLSWDRCVLVLLFQPPGRARRIVAAPSRRAITRFPGVLAVDKVSPAGTTVDWRDGTNLAIAWVWIAADNHVELRARLLAVVDFLASEFDFTDEAGEPVVDRSWADQLATES